MQAVIDSDRYLCMTIPTFKQARFGRLQGDHNVQIMQLYRCEIFPPTMTAHASINTSPSLSRKGLASDYYIKPYKL